ncbi:hypothetical protein OG413_41300 [Streptomyces sp. NBC_01433]|uniref:hypothetical protein n=1 Tax=Streptomyces sp. NBC_01433 TaxID=2903864 RepID=UPI00225284E1|nr:hypothetical protein [Streptomyces sp. NBC_01433]MCX4681641.1 hypothetical protein [Streptomyces sp. NBC_01433]
MHDHAREAATGLEAELTDVLEAAGIPLAYVLDDPDGNSAIVVTSGVSLLTDPDGAVIAVALAHDGYSTASGIEEEAAICHRTRQALRPLGYPMTRDTRSDNTLRVTARPTLD